MSKPARFVKYGDNYAFRAQVVCSDDEGVVFRLLDRLTKRHFELLRHEFEFVECPVPSSSPVSVVSTPTTTPSSPSPSSSPADDVSIVKAELAVDVDGLADHTDSTGDETDDDIAASVEPELHMNKEGLFDMSNQLFVLKRKVTPYELSQRQFVMQVLPTFRDIDFYFKAFGQGLNHLRRACLEQPLELALIEISSKLEQEYGQVNAVVPLRLPQSYQDPTYRDSTGAVVFNLATDANPITNNDQFSAALLQHLPVFQRVALQTRDMRCRRMHQNRELWTLEQVYQGQRRKWGGNSNNIITTNPSVVNSNSKRRQALEPRSPARVKRAYNRYHN